MEIWLELCEGMLNKLCWKVGRLNSIKWLTFIIKICGIMLQLFLLIKHNYLDTAIFF